MWTEIRTADGERLILYHDVPLTEDEKAELEKLTTDEFKLIAKVLLGFEERQMVEFLTNEPKRKEILKEILEEG